MFRLRKVLESLLIHRFPHWFHRAIIRLLVCRRFESFCVLPALPILPGYEVTPRLQQRTGCSHLNSYCVLLLSLFFYPCRNTTKILGFCYLVMCCYVKANLLRQNCAKLQWYEFSLSRGPHNMCITCKVCTVLQVHKKNCYSMYC